LLRTQSIGMYGRFQIPVTRDLGMINFLTLFFGLLMIRNSFSDEGHPASELEGTWKGRKKINLGP
jgi:hypothetical protein